MADSVQALRFIDPRLLPQASCEVLANQLIGNDQAWCESLLKAYDLKFHSGSGTCSDWRK